MAKVLNEEYDGNAVRVVEQEVERGAHIPERKKQNITHITEKQLRKARHQNIKFANVASTVVVVAIVTSLLIMSIAGQVQINELTSDINGAQKNLAELQGVGVQLEMQASTSFNDEEIRNYVEAELGMQEIDDTQTTYINMTNEDEGTIHIDKSKNILDKFLALFGFDK